METAFPIVLTVVVIVSLVAALLSLIGRGRLYEGIGKGDLYMDEPDFQSGPPPGSAAAKAEAEAEIRQLVEAKSARREARGQAPLDIEAEVAALTRPPEAARDEALREEVRQLVVARNERRMRKGQAPLDVEAEIDRQLRDAGG